MNKSYKSQNIRTMICCFFVIGLLATGCSNSVTTPALSGEVTDTIEIDTPLVPVEKVPEENTQSAGTSTPITIPTSIDPTLSSEETDQFILKLLQTNGDCELPCFWGIMPGETPLEEALRFFENLGSSRDLRTSLDGHFQVASYAFSVKDDQLSMSVSLYSKKEVVDSIVAIIWGVSQAGIAVTDWSFFAPTETIPALGVPTRVLLGLPHPDEQVPDGQGGDGVTNYWLVYDNAGVYLSYNGLMKAGTPPQICPLGRAEEDEGMVQLLLRAPERKIGPFGWDQLMPGGVYLYQASNISLEDFHNIFVNGDPSKCFEIDDRYSWNR